MKNRLSSHFIETKARDSIRCQINSYKDGNALFRELSERDYGVDAVIEVFDNGVPTGKFALVQIKGSSKTIQPLKRSNYVSCKISSSNARYAQQNHIPVYLMYISLLKPKSFYFITLQKALTPNHLKKAKKQKEITIHIPIESNTMENIESIFQEINDFYSQPQKENNNGDI